MPRFKMPIISADSSDLAQYDRQAALVKEAGFKYITCGTLAEFTLEQIYDKDDFWLRWAIQAPGLMKIVETDLINGIFSREHIDKNARLAAEKQDVLARHGLTGVAGFLEPQILPESFYEKHPHLRGARCDNPCYARNPYYSPCLDQPEVLAHYREAVRKFLELAPEVGVISMFTNDSGAGTCWCSGLYPGPNGPDHCRNVTMGKRIGKWLKVMHQGAADAGRKIEIIFRPLHFSKYETLDVIENLPARTRLSFKRSLAPNRSFLLPENKELLERSKECGRPAVIVADPTMGYQLGPLTERPLPYYIFDVYREAARSDAYGVSGPSISEGIDGVDSPTTMATISSLKRPAKTGAEIERRVMKIAKAQVGTKLADVLVSAWRDVDHAVRLWPNYADTNNFLFMPNSLVGDRWLLRPIVPAPKLLTEEETAYFSKYRHMSRDRADSDSFFIWHNTKNYKIHELKWLVVLFEEMAFFMNRATEDMKAAMDSLDSEEEGIRKRFMREYRRIGALRAFWRTQKNVLRAGSIIEFFTGEKQDEYWNVLRKDEYCYEPATYRRFFLEATDDEIANCRELIELMSESDVPLFWTAEKEESFALPTNMAELFEKKIALMEAHRGDIDILFPNCPAETFADPTYEWADNNQDVDRDIRERDAARLGEN